LVPLGRELSDRRLANNTFLIAAHSDGKGRADHMVDLCLYLIRSFGIGPESLVAKGMGAKHLKNARDPLAVARRGTKAPLTSEMRR